MRFHLGPVESQKKEILILTRRKRQERQQINDFLETIREMSHRTNGQAQRETTMPAGRHRTEAFTF